MAEDILIVGAGVTGLVAATLLQRQGFRPRLLEARERAGGRVLSVKLSPKEHVALGPEFVHGLSPRMRELYERYGLKLQPVKFESHVFYQGKLFKKPGFFEAIKKAFSQLSKDDLPEQSVEAALQSVGLGLDAEELKLFRTYIEGFHAAETAKLGLKELLHTEGFDSVDEEDETNYRIEGGYDALIEALQSELRDAEWHFGCAVREIRWRPGGVTLESDRGEIFKSSRALITLPVGVLKSGDCRFAPSLLEKEAALGKIHSGDVLRLTLLFSERFWEELVDSQGRSLKDLSFVQAPDEEFATFWTPPVPAPPQWVVWSGGAHIPQLFAMSTEDMADRALSQIARLLRLPPEKLKEKFRGAYRHDWARDPWSLGAYTYLGVDGLEAQKILAQPVEKTLFFAGEALSPNQAIGTVDAAVASADRAVQEILS